MIISDNILKLSKYEKTVSLCKKYGASAWHGYGSNFAGVRAENQAVTPQNAEQLSPAGNIRENNLYKNEGKWPLTKALRGIRK